MVEEPTNGNGEIRAATSAVDLPPLSGGERKLAILSELRVLENDILLARANFARQVGMTFGGKRDVYGILGYKDFLTSTDYRLRYERGGIAGRVVDVMPQATWRGGMEVIEDEDPKVSTKFEKAWEGFDKRLQVQSKLLRVDKLAGLSTFSVLLIGEKTGSDLSTELPKGKSPEDIIFLTPFSGGGGPPTNRGGQRQTTSFDADASVFEYDTDIRSPRFGLPKSYQLKRVSVSDALARPVHWSRIIHIAEGVLDDEVHGQPTLERVWNDLDNLDKVAGGGAEAFWLRANQGVHFNVDKDMATPDLEIVLEKFKEQAEKYKHQIDRWIRTKGTDVSTLGSDVANFSNPVDSILTLIAGAKAIPKRILTGSEMGELASSQDRENFKDQINGRQTQYAGPYIVRPLVDRLIAYGYLPEPAEGPNEYQVKWSHIQTMTEEERVQGAAGWAGVNATMGVPVFTTSEIREKWADREPLTDEQKAEIEAEKAAAQPPAPEAPPEDVAKLKAAESAEDLELIRVLAAAIEAGNDEVISEIIGTELRDLGDVDGHPFHGNQHTGGGEGVERSGVVEGKKAKYVLRVEGKTVGKIERIRQRDPMIGGPQSFTFMWHAKRNPYDTGRGFDAQDVAETWLIESSKKEAPGA